jgi:cytochrome d ubiquinol oxidase subunit I
MALGREVIAAVERYRSGEIDEAERAELKTFIDENMKYFGYGFIRDKSELVPYIPVNFWAFRVMVGLGCLFILYFAVLVIMAFRVPVLSMLTRRLLAAFALIPETEVDGSDLTRLPAWHYWVPIVLLPMAYIASESGWLVAEFGRQPWTIQDMLPTWAAVSDLNAGSVMLTFILFLILFTTMLAVEINILLKQIKKGPEEK